MSKELNLGIIPIGNVDHYNFMKRNLKNITIMDQDKYLKQWEMDLKYFDDYHGIEDLPVQIPKEAEGILIQDNIRFKIHMGRVLFDDNNEYNLREDYFTPFEDRIMSYKEASRASCNKIISEFADTIIFVTPEFLNQKENCILSSMINECRKSGRYFRTVTKKYDNLFKELIATINKSEAVEV